MKQRLFFLALFFTLTISTMIVSQTANEFIVNVNNKSISLKEGMTKHEVKNLLGENYLEQIDKEINCERWIYLQKTDEKKNIKIRFKNELLQNVTFFNSDSTKEFEDRNDASMNDLIIKLDKDTLFLPFTYCWTSGGPFIGLCGDTYSLVFTGTITAIGKEIKKVRDLGFSEEGTFREGIILLEEIKFNPQPESDGYPLNKITKRYKNEHYFKSDCFYGTNLKEGDKVIVFVYSYEHGYCLPQKSILKVENFYDPIILSIESYIKNKLNPLSIANDIDVRNNYDPYYANHLKQIIECKLSITK